MPNEVLDLIRAQKRRGKRALNLQHALDHTHAVLELLDDEDDHQLRAYASDLRASLTVARDAMVDLIVTFQREVDRLLSEPE